VDELKNLDEHLNETDWIDHIINLDRQLESIINCVANLKELANNDLKIKKKNVLNGHEDNIMHIC